MLVVVRASKVQSIDSLRTGEALVDADGITLPPMSTALRACIPGFEEVTAVQ